MSTDREKHLDRHTNRGKLIYFMCRGGGGGIININNSIGKQHTL